jgi:1-acyl-sn-glycerol-3-phosphate acyltransferase
MQKTIYHTPVISHAMHYIARGILSVLGWTVQANPQDVPKYVVIAAPHTSNWDFFYTMLLAFALKLQVYAMGKKSLTEGPFGPIMLWFGIIPIDRSKSNNVVEQTIAEFSRHDQLVIVIPPSGTRDKVRYWKTGFYHIAHGAGVPIALGFIDYKRKCGGIGPFITTSGDIDQDMVKIKAFYSDITGKIPENQIDFKAG